MLVRINGLDWMTFSLIYTLSILCLLTLMYLLIAKKEKTNAKKPASTFATIIPNSL